MRFRVLGCNRSRATAGGDRHCHDDKAQVVVGVVTFSALALIFDRTRIASLFRVMRPA